MKTWETGRLLVIIFVILLKESNTSRSWLLQALQLALTFPQQMFNTHHFGLVDDGILPKLGAYVVHGAGFAACHSKTLAI